MDARYAAGRRSLRADSALEPDDARRDMERAFGSPRRCVWTMFGTTLGFWRHLRGYAEVDALSLFRQYSLRHMARHVGRLVVSAPATIRRARRMNRRWPGSDDGPSLERTLA